MGWYWYTSLSGDHFTQCNMGWCRCTCHSQNHCTKCEYDTLRNVRMSITVTSDNLAADCYQWWLEFFSSGWAAFFLLKDTILRFYHTIEGKLYNCFRNYIIFKCASIAYPRSCETYLRIHRNAARRMSLKATESP